MARPKWPFINAHSFVLSIPGAQSGLWAGGKWTVPEEGVCVLPFTCTGTAETAG